ncbi:Metacaspase-9 [Platanthera guangdongensis]|uniref:Metacaspase-9 n=1 Tax=Platanthera guangdongensis TaxID=2320717 RepID=A0ABR2LU22_9ASPA
MRKRLATLVGCNYPGTRNELRGCVNDVEAMKDLLVERFGFDAADIVVLTDGPGSQVLPTGANVRRALGHMVDRAVPNDVLFFHFSGHGTLVPAARSHNGHRHRDEAIVPCDFNLITDVDFRDLVDRLPKDASFTMLSDSCHSGGLIDDEKEQVGPTNSPISDRRPTRRQPKYIPYESVFGHLTSLSGLTSPHVADHLSAIFGPDASPKFIEGAPLHHGDDNGILLSGCQANETSADMSAVEIDGTEKKAFGAFSNAVQMVARGWEEREAASYREVVERAREVLRDQGFEQHPCLYCNNENAGKPFLMMDGK